MNPLHILKLGGVKFIDALNRLNLTLDVKPYCEFVRHTSEIAEVNDQYEVAQGLLCAFDITRAGRWIEHVPDVVPYLQATFAAGFKPGWADENGKTLLHHAATFGTPEKAEKACSFVTEQGVDVMAKDRDGYRATSYTFESQWAGSSPLNDVLHKPLTEASRGFARSLLKMGENPNALEVRSGNRPLHQLMLTVDGKSQPIVMRDNMAEILLEAGARPNIPDAFGRTALHLASMVEDGDRLCERLLAHGADPSAKDCDGRTAAELKLLPQSEKRLHLERFLAIGRYGPAESGDASDVEIEGDGEVTDEFPQDVLNATPPVQPVPANSDELSMSIAGIVPPVVPEAPKSSPGKERPKLAAMGNQPELF